VTTTGALPPCELCDLVGVAAMHPSAPSVVLVRDKFTVILVDDANYPGFARVVWNAHVREVSDLADEDRLLLNDAVWRVEKAVREVLQPLKVNVASLGNVVPHLHWHVIPRFLDDAHFPAPVWASVARVAAPDTLAQRRALLPQLAQAIERQFAD
jgi:diadenosine tetraphosphate (Ap4A) HIT family hydrolase